MMERTIVRCSEGGLYSTIWWKWGSLKAVRLGPLRVQRCPIHHRWEKPRRANIDELTATELAAARSVVDTALP